MVTRPSPFVDALVAARLIAVIRAQAEVAFADLAELLLTGNVRFLEVTLTTPGALSSIGDLQPYRQKGLLVGAGTVLTAGDAESAVRAGVDFLVSPVVEPDVSAVGHEAGCGVILGGLTPGEILAAWRAGADVVKVFPGRVATPGYFADLAGPFPHIRLMPTGNVDLKTAPEYLAAGAVAVGVGKAIVNPQHLRDRRYEDVRADISRWRGLIDGVPEVHP
jgi:2-dehydro-3-deoxyphosphogluconate aldolase / (4S)-4-hydroxy-2-oxoglutarate aldolase